MIMNQPRQLKKTCFPGRTNFILGLMLFFALGCGLNRDSSIESGYAKTSGLSVNGLNAFATMLRNSGHDVRFAQGVDEEVADFAEIIIRCADRPGPPSQLEAELFDAWLNERVDAWVIYAPRDTEMLVDYWSSALQDTVTSGNSEDASRFKKKLDSARAWPRSLPNPAKPAVSSASNWFQTQEAVNATDQLGQDWQGPWADDEINWRIRQTMQSNRGITLLSCSKGPVIIRNEHRIFLANAGLFLNAGLVERNRRLLLQKLLEEVELNISGRRVVILVGDDLMNSEVSPNALWAFLTTWPTSVLAIHLIFIGVLGCWSKAIRFGPIRRDQSQSWSLLSNHARAVGRLIWKSPEFTQKAELVFSQYAKWRFTRTDRQVKTRIASQETQQESGGET